MALSRRQRSLKAWSKQKWRTKSGKKSSVTGERYLPEAAIKSLSASKYAATTRAKRRDKKKGKQFSKQPKRIAKKVNSFPSNQKELLKRLENLDLYSGVFFIFYFYIKYIIN